MQSVKPRTLGFGSVPNLRVVRSSPKVGSVFSTDSASDSLSLPSLWPLALPTLCVLSLSLSNKHFFFKRQVKHNWNLMGDNTWKSKDTWELISSEIWTKITKSLKWIHVQRQNAFPQKYWEKPMPRATGVRDMGPKITKEAAIIDGRLIKINPLPTSGQICTVGSTSEIGTCHSPSRTSLLPFLWTTFVARRQLSGRNTETRMLEIWKPSA